MSDKQRASDSGDLRWNDLRFPFTGSNIDVGSGRLDYDYFNGGIGFQANARYPNEPVFSVAQLPHSWKIGTMVRPHIHWLQQSANEPNWLLAYKFSENGAANAIETDYSNYTFLTKASNAFTYTSGVILQITNFGMIDTTGLGLSDTIDFAFFRDNNNTSGEFAGSDPSNLVEIVKEFDVHYQIDDRGSSDEFSK